MKEIVNLVKFDFITVKAKSMVPFTIIILIMLIASIFDSNPYIISCMIVFTGYAAVPAFSIAEQCNYNKIYGILPVKKRNIVFGRYVFGLVLILAVTLISILVGYIVKAASFGEKFKLSKDMAYLIDEWEAGGLTIPLIAALFFFFGCCLSAVQYTLLFVFGVSKEIPSAIGFAMVFAAAVLIPVKVFKFDMNILFNFISNAVVNHGILTMTVLYAAGVFIMAIGGLISSVFFCKREL